MRSFMAPVVIPPGKVPCLRASGYLGFDGAGLRWEGLMGKWFSVGSPKPSQHDSDKSKLVLVGVTFAKTAWTFHACLCLILKGKPVVPCGVDFGLPLELLPTYSRDEKRVRLSWLLFAVWWAK